jgi:hypothetical protein
VSVACVAQSASAVAQRSAGTHPRSEAESDPIAPNSTR